MSSQKTITVAIKAQDGASKSFLALGKSAQTASSQLSAAGRAASADLAKLDAAAAKASVSAGKVSTSLTGVGKSMSAVHGAISGAAFATFLGFMSDASRAAAEEEAGLQRLQQAIENTGVSYDAFSGRVDKAVASAQTLAFADDQAVDALNTLTSTTGNAAKSIELLSVAEDLARGKNIDLQTAAQIVGKVYAGNTGILQRYGIVLRAGASSTEAIAAVQAKFSGQSERFAQTNAAAIDRWRNDLDNLVESIGGSTGALQVMLGVLPGVTSGMQLAGAAAGGLTEALGGGSGLAALATSLGPFGLAAGVTAAAVGLLAKSVIDYHIAADEAADPTDSLTAAIIRLQQAGLDTSVAQQISEGWDKASASMAAAEVELAKIREQQSATVNVDLRKELDAQAAAQQNATLAADQRAAVEQDLDAILVHQGANQAFVLDATKNLVEQYNAGTLSAADFAKFIDEIANKLDTYGYSVETATSATGAWRAGVDDVTLALANQYEAINLGAQGLGIYAAQAKAAAAAGRDAASAVAESLRAKSAAGQFVDPSTSLGIERPAGQAATDAAALQDASAKREAQRLEDLKQAQEDHARAVEKQQSELRSYAEEVVSAQDAEADRAKQIADINQQAADQQSAAAKTLQSARKDADRGYTQTVKSAAKERVDIEKDAAKQIADLDQQRADVAKDVQSQLADLAGQRADIEAQSIQELSDAQKQYQQTQADTAQRQEELRHQLKESVSEASQEWRDAVKENAQQLADVKRDLERTLADLHRSFARSIADIQTERQRSAQDIAATLADPTISNEDKNAAILDYNRSLEDSATEEQRLRDDNARAETAARRQAAQEERAAQQDKKAAAKDYHDAVTGLESDTASQIKDLQKQAADAAQTYHDKVAGIRDDEAQQLADLGAQQQRIAEEAGQKYADIETQKRAAANETAAQLRQLDQDTADAAKQRQKELTAAQRDYNSAIQESAAAAQSAISDVQTELTPLERALQDGYLTQNQFDRIMEQAPEVDQFFKDVDAWQAAQQGKALLDVQLVPENVRNDPGWKNLINKTGPFGTEGATVTVKGTTDPSYQATTETVKGDIGDLTGSVKTVSIGLAKDKGWDAAYTGISAAVTDLSGKVVTIPIQASTGYGNSPGAKAGLTTGAAAGIEPWDAKKVSVELQRDALSKTSATIAIKADSSAFNQVISQLKETYQGQVFATSYIQLKVRNPDGTVVEGPTAAPTASPPPKRPPTKKALGGFADGWFLAGDPGPQTEAIYAPGGAYVLSAAATRSRFGDMLDLLPAFAKGGHHHHGGGGGQNPAAANQIAAAAKPKKTTGQGSAQWKKYLKSIGYAPAAQAWIKGQFNSLSKDQISGLVHGDLKIVHGDNGVWYIADAGDTSIPGRDIIAGAGGEGNRTARSAATPTQEPLPSPAPIPPLPPTPAPLPVTNIAGDLPVFTGTSSPFAITAAARATLQQQQGQAIAALQAGGAAQPGGQSERAGGTISVALRELRREIAELRKSLASVAEIQQRPLANYGTLYIQTGPDTGAALDAARASSTALRF